MTDIAKNLVPEMVASNKEYEQVSRFMIVVHYSILICDLVHSAMHFDDKQ